tara:strand:+ start:642 stop:899 length:258 start_codon:yes stop_codon:yes gene_type:complete
MNTAHVLIIVIVLVDISMETNILQTVLRVVIGSLQDTKQMAGVAIETRKRIKQNVGKYPLDISVNVQSMVVGLVELSTQHRVSVR